MSCQVIAAGLRFCMHYWSFSVAVYCSDGNLITEYRTQPTCTGKNHNSFIEDASDLHEVRALYSLTA